MSASCRVATTTHSITSSPSACHMTIITSATDAAVAVVVFLNAYKYLCHSLLEFSKFFLQSHFSFSFELLLKGCLVTPDCS